MIIHVLPWHTQAIIVSLPPSLCSRVQWAASWGTPGAWAPAQWTCTVATERASVSPAPSASCPSSKDAGTPPLPPKAAISTQRQAYALPFLLLQEDVTHPSPHFCTLSCNVFIGTYWWWLLILITYHLVSLPVPLGSLTFSYIGHHIWLSHIELHTDRFLLYVMLLIMLLWYIHQR